MVISEMSVSDILQLYREELMRGYDANGSPVEYDMECMPIFPRNPTTKAILTAEESSSKWPVDIWEEDGGSAGYGTGIGFPHYSDPEVVHKKCKHEWLMYTGLSEQFEYCKHCDIKKDEETANV